MTRKSRKKGAVYGGEIHLADFSTSCPNRNRIQNQIEANHFYKELEMEKQRKEKEKLYRSMTVDELRKSKLLSNGDGRPGMSLTDEKWQKEFYIRKLFLTPFSKEIKKLGGKYSKESGFWQEETQGYYTGPTNWQEYCSYINDILDNIRAGQIDYCYFIYQIMDLAKFHFEDLKTRYCGGYWEVWLEK